MYKDLEWCGFEVIWTSNIYDTWDTWIEHHQMNCKVKPQDVMEPLQRLKNKKAYVPYTQYKSLGERIDKDNKVRKMKSLTKPFVTKFVTLAWWLKIINHMESIPHDRAGVATVSLAKSF